jgi:hypothetical protein
VVLKVTDAGGDVGLHIRMAEIPPYWVPKLPAPRPPLRFAPAVKAPKLATLLARGIVVKPGCSASCRTTVVATVAQANAKRLKLRSTRVGKATGTSGAVRLKVDAKPRKALRKVRSVRLRLAISVVGADGKALRATRALTVKR